MNNGILKDTYLYLPFKLEFPAIDVMTHHMVELGTAWLAVQARRSLVLSADTGKSRVLCLLDLVGGFKFS